MATKLLICPSVISPIDKLDVESLRILLYIIACKKGEKRKLLKLCNHKRIVPVECIISLYLGLSFSQSLTWDREMETEWEKAQERELIFKNSNSS